MVVTVTLLMTFHIKKIYYNRKDFSALSLYFSILVSSFFGFNQSESRRESEGLVVAHVACLDANFEKRETKKPACIITIPTDPNGQNQEMFRLRRDKVL